MGIPCIYLGLNSDAGYAVRDESSEPESCLPVLLCFISTDTGGI